MKLNTKQGKEHEDGLAVCVVKKADEPQHCDDAPFIVLLHRDRRPAFSVSSIISIIKEGLPQASPFRHKIPFERRFPAFSAYASRFHNLMNPAVEPRLNLVDLLCTLCRHRLMIDCRGNSPRLGNRLLSPHGTGNASILAMNSL
jgi:hypothetical protein